MKLVLTSVVLFLAVLVIPAAVAEGEGGDCIVALDEADGRTLPQGVRAVAPGASEQRARVLFACQAGRVSGLTVRLVPGHTAEAGLVLVGLPEHTPGLISENGLPPDWRRVGVRRLDPDTVLVTLEVVAPEAAETGRVFSDQLRLGPAGEHLDVPVTLEIIDDAPLFRDEFGVDPVIGQFSMTQDAHEPLFSMVSGLAD